jgi:phage shock protein A
MSFFAKLWSRIRGFFISAGDDLVSSSPQAISATYAAAIDDAKRRYKDMERAVALLARERDRVESTLKSLNQQEAELQNKLEGALAAAEADPANLAHKEAGTRYLTKMQEIDQKQAALTGELETQKIKVEEYKGRLRSFADEIERLKREQGEMVAEFVSNQQIVQLEDRLRGLAESAVDESIVAIRDKVATLKAHAKLAAEMRGATLTNQDQTYERIGTEKMAAARFDELLKSRSARKVGVPAKERDLG